MTDDTFAAAFADDLRAYADADVRSVDAAALARALMDRPVARSTRPWGAVRLSRIGAHRRLVSVVAVMLTVALLGLAVAGSRPHESRLAYATVDGLFIAGGDGGRPTLIAAPDSVGGIETVRWAPDGRHLAAALYGRGLQPLPPGREVSHYHYVVRVLTPDGQQTGQFELFNHFYALMSWSPDSTQVAILDIDRQREPARDHRRGWPCRPDSDGAAGSGRWRRYGRRTRGRSSRSPRRPMVVGPPSGASPSTAPTGRS